MNSYPWGRPVLVLESGRICFLDLAFNLDPAVQFPSCGEVIVTRSRHPRYAAPAELAAGFARHGLSVRQCTDTAEAIAEALRIAEKDDLICATGSLFIVAEVIEEVQGLSGEVYSL